MTNKEAIVFLYLLEEGLSEIKQLNSNGRKYLLNALNMAIKVLEERTTGHWIEDIYEEYTPNHDTWECSNCGEPYLLMGGTPEENKYNYCPNCGARMEKPL